jgi:tRNA dimethylallyltransferase
LRKILISIVGPTGIGKSYIAYCLALILNTEIISCDSKQFYKELNIGTSKPGSKILHSVNHHFINSLSVVDKYSVKQFEIDAIKKINKLFMKYDYLIMVGGSGLYEKSIIEGLNDIPIIPDKVIVYWNNLFVSKGLQYLQYELKNKDYLYYKKVDLYNPKRLIRALSVITYTNNTFSYFLNKKIQPRLFKYVRIGLNIERYILYELINNRVDDMLKNNLLDEARDLYYYKNYYALNTIGYKEVFMYIDKIITYDEMIYLIKKNSRNYAKRQLTWFKKKFDIYWFYPKKDIIINFVKNYIKNYKFYS